MFYNRRKRGAGKIILIEITSINNSILATEIKSSPSLRATRSNRRGLRFVLRETTGGTAFSLAFFVVVSVLK